MNDAFMSWVETLPMFVGCDMKTTDLHVAPAGLGVGANTYVLRHEKGLWAMALDHANEPTEKEKAILAVAACQQFATLYPPDYHVRNTLKGVLHDNRKGKPQ